MTEHHVFRVPGPSNYPINTSVVQWLPVSFFFMAAPLKCIFSRVTEQLLEKVPWEKKEGFLVTSGSLIAF